MVSPVAVAANDGGDTVNEQSGAGQGVGLDMGEVLVLACVAAPRCYWSGAAPSKLTAVTMCYYLGGGVVSPKVGIHPAVSSNSCPGA